MRRHFRPPSASTVIASIALLAALGGTSYAAATITSDDIKNYSIRSIDVKNSSLTGRDIKNSSLTTSDVKNGSLLPKDFKSSQLPAGPPGAPGVDAFGQLTYATSDPLTVADGEEGNATAYCPEGLIPTGGGVLSTSNTADPGTVVDMTVNSSYPFVDDSGAGWDVWAENQSGEDQDTTAYAICASAELVDRKTLKLSRSRRR